MAELDHALRGDRRLKADFPAEARDSLVDVAQSYEAAGYCPAEAEARAVDEFGAVDRIAPRYRAELALSQVRSTALTLFFLLGGQHLLFEYAWGALPAGTPRPGPAYALLATIVNGVCLATIICAFVAALACGIGARLGQPARLPASVGSLALGAVVGMLLAGTVLTVFSPIYRGNSTFGSCCCISRRWSH